MNLSDWKSKRQIKEFDELPHNMPTYYLALLNCDALSKRVKERDRDREKQSKHPMLNKLPANNPSKLIWLLFTQINENCKLLQKIKNRIKKITSHGWSGSRNGRKNTEDEVANNEMQQFRHCFHYQRSVKKNSLLTKLLGFGLWRNFDFQFSCKTNANDYIVLPYCFTLGKTACIPLSGNGRGTGRTMKSCWKSYKLKIINVNMRIIKSNNKTKINKKLVVSDLSIVW